MPFKNKFNNPWFYGIKPVAELKGLRPMRADDIKLPAGRINEDITRLIIESEIIIAEMTDQNPNFLYELGLAHAAKKKVIMITQIEEDIPFDIKGIRYIHYDPDQLEEFKYVLSQWIDNLLNDYDSKDFFPHLKVLTPKIEKELAKLKKENYELISLANPIKITTSPPYSYCFLNNRFIGICPQTIYINPKIENILTVFAIEHFEEYLVIENNLIINNCINISLEKRNSELFPQRMHNWLKYIRLNPDDIVIGRAIATYLEFIGEHEEAINQQKELLKICDNWSMLYNGIGSSFMCLEEYDEAIKYFKKVVELEDSYIGHYNLACAFSMSKQSEKAIEKIKLILDNKEYMIQLFNLHFYSYLDKSMNFSLTIDQDFIPLTQDPYYSDEFDVLDKKCINICKQIYTCS